MKTIKGVISAFVLLIFAGLLVTFTTTQIISQKRAELYAYKEGTGDVTSATEQTTDKKADNISNGPMSNIMTKQKYLEPIKAEEEVIADLWAGISDDSSAMRVVMYERNYWDNQFDNILQMYYSIQPIDNIDAVKQEETSFVAQRESLSQDAAKAAGETYTGLQYSKEHARITKEKTYELINRYFAEE